MQNMTIRSSRLMVVAGLVGCCWVAAGAQSQRQPIEPGKVEIGARLGVAGFTVQDVTLNRAKNSKQMFAHVALDGVDRTLVLDPHDLRAPEMTAFEQLPDGSMRYIETAEPNTYAGVIQGVADSMVRVSIDELGGVQGIIFSGDSAWGIQPLREVQPDAAATAHVIYRQDEVRLPEGMCGVIDDQRRQQPLTEGGIAGAGVTALKQLDIALDADFEFYTLNGSNTTATINDMMSVMNAVEGMYQREVGIAFRITTTLVRTAEPDPYTATNAGTLLAQFANEWLNNQGVQVRDLAHMFTGKELDGTTIGIAANIGVVCQTPNPGAGIVAYCLAQSRWNTNFMGRVSVSAHEIGHTLNGTHCDGNPQCALMCSGVGGCNGQMTQFGVSAATIIAYRDATTCMAPMGACCLGTSCTQVPADECAQAGGTWAANTPCATRSVYTANPGVVIPDGSGVNVTSTINVPDSFTVSDVNVRLNISHTWVGDLIVELSHNGGVTWVPLVDRIQLPALPPDGCGSDNLNLWLDDEGTGGSIDNLCGFLITNTTPSSGPSFVPQSALSHATLQGVNASGAWTIRVRDMVAPDGGALVSWSLDLERANTSVCQPTGACCVGTTCTQTTQSGCGGTWTAGQACTESVLATATPNAAIPDGNGVPAVSIINVAQNFAITDLNVQLVVNHAWVGDLSVTLQHDSGAVRTLVARPGVPASTFGCGGDHYSIILDDEGTGGTIENMCNAALNNPTSPPNFLPSPDALSFFDGQNITGNWTLRVNDVVTPDGGILVSWGLRATGGPTNFCTPDCPGDVNNSGTVDVDDLVQVILTWGQPDNTGVVDVDDLVGVILGWGPC